MATPNRASKDSYEAVTKDLRQKLIAQGLTETQVQEYADSIKFFCALHINDYLERKKVLRQA
ncbi:MAG: hypothetical protein GC129_02085 [Proteobacteria bacterium]|nr:hypothetical protein [Pseudomonadota bacterium]